MTSRESEIRGRVESARQSINYDPMSRLVSARQLVRKDVPFLLDLIDQLGEELCTLPEAIFVEVRKRDALRAFLEFKT